jgi:uncharacterized membrane protein YeiH
VQNLIVILEGMGVFVFALSGALLGVQKRFDLFGVLFLSFVVAVTGGIIRDLLIGAVPPVAFQSIQYLLIAIAAGIVTFYWYPNVASRRRQILVLDAIGLGLFAVLGTQKALDFGINPVMAAMLGMLTGIGGGVTRDVLAGEVPSVLRADIYAVAALGAGAVVSLGHVLAVPAPWYLLLGAALCIFLRMMAIFRGWRAPTPRFKDM